MSELNFPDNASVDELNCTLFKAGNRSKRLGIEYEASYELSSFTTSSQLLHDIHIWENVGKDPDLQYAVVQNGQYLNFYSLGSKPLSGAEVPTSDADSTPYRIDMASYEYAGGLGAGSDHIDVANIDGKLVVVSPGIEPFYIERDNDTGVFTVTSITFKIRDFEYLTDRVDLTEEGAASPSEDRKYDTYNAGWTTTTVASYRSANSNAWPPLTHPWYSGKDASDNFSASEWAKVYSGNTLIVNGHFILDLFNPDRDTPSSLTGVTNAITPNARFNTVTAYASRVWYSGIDSKIYFSQFIEDIQQIGRCYQQNDPTSEEFSDLLNTDGGYVSIPEANGIKKIHVFGSSLLVFAENGVWRISGIDQNIFDPTDFSVYKITDFGLSQNNSFVAGQNAVPFWWSPVGIHTLQVTQEGGMLEVNISRETIQTFWDEISSDAKAVVQGSYDAINNRILWKYPNENETVNNKYNRFLFLDVDLGAFYPWQVSDLSSNSPYVLASVFYRGTGSDLVEYTVVDEAGNTVVDASGNEVIVELEANTLKSSEIYFLVYDPTTAKVTFATFTATEFVDWGSANYEAYAEAAYNFVGDLGRRKNSPYITVFMKQTETGFERLGSTYNPLRESSLKVSAYWDFKKAPATTAQEAYRHKLPIVVDPNDLTNFPSPTTVLSTRLKLRGRGRVMKLRFEGSQGKDFNLLGWETLDTVNNGY